MDIDEFMGFLKECDLDQLREVEAKICELIKRRQTQSMFMDKPPSENLRSESRFDIEIHASIKRVTDVKPGEKTEYEALIRDISRQGMGLRVSPNFIYSRAVTATFQGPQGKMKQANLEVVRMRRCFEQDRQWLELGCRGITAEEIQRILSYERKDSAMQRQLQQKSAIQVFVVSSHADTAKEMVEQVRTEGYRVTAVRRVQQVIKAMKPEENHLAILVHVEDICRDKEQLLALAEAPAQLATVAVVDDEPQRCALMRAGVDECLTTAQVEAALFRTMERAVVGHAMRRNVKLHSDAPKALLVCADNTRVNMLSFHLEENDLEWRPVTNAANLHEDDFREFDIIIADFDAARPEDFRTLVNTAEGTPVIAVCEHLSQGNHTVAMGAADYLSLPLHANQMRVMLHAILPQLAAEPMV